ncbi:MAG: PSD1 domain-containing protein [Verrucomicrobiae bacterium]|nr:PSD1 domain-containing protein [Verrucomicrobiae bacterium]
MKSSRSSWGAILLATATGVLTVRAAEDTVDFSHEIRPILSDRCFKCHGFDDETREADLGLHTFDFATEDLGGYQAIKPGDPDASEIIVRMMSDDPDDVMPPAKANKPHLSPEEIDLFRRWIKQGAKYEQHWAFVKPVRPEPPAIAQKRATVRNPIDQFVLARLERENLAPSPEADPHTLIRRLSLDLVGLPPTPEEADAFAKAYAADGETAYLAAVDRLLDSKHYGERWARQWLDLARYADTNGYEKDRPRSIWPYRDWVIEALNADMPFDRFSIEQLAGDMLPNATADQRIATGFHRNTMLNEEGGIDPLEYRFYAMIDRVNTTGTTWLGLTVGCAQCHTHKYDPITQTDYYAMMGLLNNADEPAITVPDSQIAAKKAATEKEITKAEAELIGKIDPTKFDAWLIEQKAQSAPWTSLEPTSLKSNLPHLVREGDGVVFASGDFTKRDVFTLTYDLSGISQPITAFRLEALPDERLPANGPGAAYYEGRSGDFFLSEVAATSAGRKLAFSGASHDFGKIYIGNGSAAAENVFDGDGSTGWSTATAEGRPHEIVISLATPLDPASGPLEIELLFERHFVAALGKFRLSATTATHPVAARALPPIDPLSASDKELRLAYARTAAEMAEARKPLEAIEKKRPELPTTLVMQERPDDNPRTTHRHHRGEYLNTKEEVTPAVPKVFPPLPEGAPANRLSFAKWLVDPERNPLVARVTVNRAWRAFFGRGLLNTAGDFGVQSEPPSHPELLDWLAVEFVERGWSLKQLHRLIVTSATYRQDARTTPELLERDPTNTLLARGPRFRLDAEIIRDSALATSGLLSEKLGGPSVYPPQPPSVSEAAYGSPKWTPSPGQDRYRRSLYTFAKRTAPFAAYLTFDGPTGEACIARRDRSNTPLQALTLMNDTMFTEAAAALADSTLSGLGPNPVESEIVAAELFRRVLTREPDQSELTDLIGYYESQLARLKTGELATEKIGGNDSATPEHAAWTMVARVILNLDEAVTKG